jgi:hypothetical protein
MMTSLQCNVANLLQMFKRSILINPLGHQFKGVFFYPFRQVFHKVLPQPSEMTHRSAVMSGGCRNLSKICLRIDNEALYYNL